MTSPDTATATCTAVLCRQMFTSVPRKHTGMAVTALLLPVHVSCCMLLPCLQTHLCAPEASFPAHIAGVVAGLLRAYCLEPGAGRAGSGTPGCGGWGRTRLNIMSRC